MHSGHAQPEEYRAREGWRKGTELTPEREVRIPGKDEGEVARVRNTPRKINVCGLQ